MFIYHGTITIQFFFFLCLFVLKEESRFALSGQFAFVLCEKDLFVIAITVALCERRLFVITIASLLNSILLCVYVNLCQHNKDIITLASIVTE